MRSWQRVAHAERLLLLILVLLFAAACQGNDNSGNDGGDTDDGGATAVAEGPSQDDSPTSTPEAGGSTGTPVPLDKPSATATASSVAVSESPTPTPTPTTEPTATPSPTLPPTATLVPTQTPTPSATPTVTPTPSPTPLPEPDWLKYLNQFRDLAGLPHLAEDTELSRASRAHAVYIVRTNEAAAHSESPNSPHYSPEGASVAAGANLFATTQVDGNYDWASNFWMSGPFHILQIIDPALATVGYGQHNQGDGNIQMAGVLEVAKAPRQVPSPDVYPLYFPKDGGQTWIVRKSMYEWPEPYGRCPGYSFQPPSGPTIALQLGDGSLTPRVTDYRLLKGDQVVESCVFDETTYEHPNAYTQAHGRVILGERDAVILIPLKPLEVGQTYTVIIEVSGETHEWRFDVGSRPALD